MDTPQKWHTGITATLGRACKSFCNFWLRVTQHWFPIACISFAIAGAAGWWKLEWPVVVLVGIAGFPVLLPLMRKYVKEIGPSGVVMLTDVQSEEKIEELAANTESRGLLANVQRGHPTPAFGSAPDQAATADPSPPNAPSVPTYTQISTWDAMPLHAKEVLKTLYVFQSRTLGLDDKNRWGFAVSAASPHWDLFIRGAFFLEAAKLAVMENPKVFLSDQGIAFCRKHAAELDALPLKYQHFDPW